MPTDIPRGCLYAQPVWLFAGGRLIKDKLFFFNSTEWTRVRSQGELLAFVPTPQLISLSAPATRDFFSAYTLAARTTGRIRTAANWESRVFRLTRPRFRKWLIQFRQIWVAAFPRICLDCNARRLDSER